MLIVAKFGGTSLRGINEIKKVVNIIKTLKEDNSKVIVVVSAPAGFTDKMLGTIKELGCGQISSKERDLAIASGEQINAALLTLALLKEGLKAVSFTAFDLQIIGRGQDQSAEILDINTQKLKAALETGIVPVITGYQALRNNGAQDIMTLGRGGSDYSAVMIAASMGADLCKIFTDVDGLYTADPRIYSKARKIDFLSYGPMALAARMGAKVLQEKSIRAAQRFRIIIDVLSTFSDTPGTRISDEILIKKSEAKFIIAHKSKLVAFLEGDIRSIIKDCQFQQTAVVETGIFNNQKVVLLDESEIPLAFQDLPVLKKNQSLVSLISTVGNQNANTENFDFSNFFQIEKSSATSFLINSKNLKSFIEKLDLFLVRILC